MSTQNQVTAQLSHYINNRTPLHQIYLIDTLVKVSKAVVEHQEEMKENMKGSPIQPEAWIQCAKDALEDFKDYNK